MSPATPDRACSHLALRRLTRLVSRHYDAHLACCGLKTTQYSLLATVTRSGPVGLGDLARLLSLDASTLTRNLQPLVKAGLMTIDAGADGRSRQVTATPAGARLRALAKPHWRRAQTSLDKTLGAEHAVSLHQVVDHCYRLLAGSETAESVSER